MTSVRAGSVCRLSPNEEAYLRQAQLEERRRARLLQVREQERRLARDLREKVKSKREAERRVLQEHVDAMLAEAHESELRELEEKYLFRVGSVGQGHRDAQMVNEEENRLQELRLLLEAKQRWRAQDRHAAAMKELSASQLKDKQMRQLALHCRQQAMEAERMRSRQVTSTVPPPNPMIIMDFEVDKSRRVQFKEAEGYSSSYYHIPHPVVQRLGTPCAGEPTAQEMARQREEEDKRTEQHAAALQQEHSEKARLRYKHAIAKVKLEKERSEMLAELQSLEREDRTSRQKALAKMPTNLFQPVHRRIEMATEQQREMEGAFERLFVRSLQGAPVAHSLPEEPSLTSEPSLSVTEHSSTADTDHPDNDPRFSEGDQGRVTTPPLKVTPDSGVHVNATTSTESSHPPPSTREGDSGVVDESSYLFTGTHKTGPPRTSHPQDDVFTSSTSSSDQSRHPPRPAWPTKSADQSHDTISTTDGERVPSRAASTQTPQRNTKQFLSRPSIVLDRPELTVTDVTSSDEQSVEGGDFRGRGRSLRGRKPPLPTQRKRSEGMKALLSMIQSQHQAWNDRFRKRDDLLPPFSSPPNPQTEGPMQQDTLSVCTLSTRESTMSPTPPPESTHQTSVHSTISDLSSSPSQLSISQYHTTMDASVMQTPPTTHAPSTSHSAGPEDSSKTAQGLTTSHPLAQCTQKYELPISTSSQAALTQKYEVPVSTSPQAVYPSLYSGSAQVSATTHDQTEDHPSTSTQSFSHVSVQSSIPHPAVTSPLVTSHWTAPIPPTHLRPSQQLQESRPTGPATQVPPHPYLEESPHTHRSPPTIGDDSQDTLDSFLPLPELAWQQPLLSTTEQATRPPQRSPTPPEVWASLCEQEHGTASSEPLTLPTRPPSEPILVDSVRATPESTSLEKYLTSPLLQCEEQPSVSDIAQEQLSIVTLDSTQLSLVENTPPRTPPVSDPPASFRLLHSEPTVHPVPHDEHLLPTQADAPPSLQAQSAFEQHGGPRELSILDTIEESGAENVVSSSDSFRGDRLQSEPPLSITGLEATGYSPTPSPSVSPTKPTLSADSQPQVESPVQMEPAEEEHSSSIESGGEMHKEGIAAPSIKTRTAETDTHKPLVHSGLSLQEAFLNRKKEFVKQSQKRLEQIKASIAEQSAQQTSSFKQTSHRTHSTPVSSKPSHSRSSVSGTRPQSKKLDSGVGTIAEKKQRVVTFSSPLLQNQDGTGMSSPLTTSKVHSAGQPSAWLFSKEREKVKKKEMKERNERFYQRLPEVHQRAEEEKRREAYTANRDKARHYQEKIRSQMRSKRGAVRTQPTKVAAVTKLKHKPPFK